MSDYATLSGPSAAEHISELVQTVNCENSPFDFRVRLISADNSRVYFMIEFFPQQRTVMYYPKYPNTATPFLHEDIFLPWFYMGFSLSNRNKTLQSIFTFYSAEQVKSTLCLDILPSFLGNHSTIGCCMGHRAIHGFNSHCPEKLSSAIFAFINHYYNSTFNDSLDYYKYADTLLHVAFMHDLHVFPQFTKLSNCHNYRDHALSCRSPHSLESLKLSQKDVQACYKILAEDPYWWSLFPRLFRTQAFLMPSVNYRHLNNLLAFVKHYEIRDSGEYRSYITEGYGDFYMDELDAFHSHPMAISASTKSSKTNPYPFVYSVFDPDQSLAISHSSEGFAQLQKLLTPVYKEEFTEQMTAFDFYWNGKS